jgi:hypothetical protein
MDPYKICFTKVNHLIKKKYRIQTGEINPNIYPLGLDPNKIAQGMVK